MKVLSLPGCKVCHCSIVRVVKGASVLTWRKVNGTWWLMKYEISTHPGEEFNPLTAYGHAITCLRLEQMWQCTSTHRTHSIGLDWTEINSTKYRPFENGPFFLKHGNHFVLCQQWSSGSQPQPSIGLAMDIVEWTYRSTAVLNDEREGRSANSISSSNVTAIQDRHTDIQDLISNLPGEGRAIWNNVNWCNVWYGGLIGVYMHVWMCMCG